MNTENKKICPRCKKELPATFEYFGKNRSNSNELDSYCKICKRDYQNKFRKGNRQYRDITAKIDIGDWQNASVIQKFKKMYLEDLMANREISEKTKLSMGNIEFLIEELGIKLSTKERNQIRIKKEKEHYTSITPSKDELEKYYKEVNFSIRRVKNKFFPKVPYKFVVMWFDNLKIERQRSIKYINKEDRIQKIIRQLKSKL